ncbi:type II toxin-antitoxin system RelE family toxin [Halomonas sp. NPDC076908]|uniref:type II toxin-antitoxin system RelE family toxin n=1 Tax=Halomonas sp. NPDC076908 TaxID=3390567 RepID=UPI003D080D2A
MTYKLRFLPAALKEWEKLGAPVKNQFKKKLAERLENPKVAADQLSGFDACYKIKLRSAGYRLVYEPESVRPAPGSTSNPLTCMAI